MRVLPRSIALRAIVLFAALFAVVPAAPAAAKSYSAERFDTRIRVLDGGVMEVVETLLLRFDDGTFTYVFRDLPRRRTDGIEIVSASMDGRTLPFGKGAGQVEVREGSKVRVRWEFAPRTASTHTFELTYRVRGVVQRQAGHDVLEWTALPNEHEYRIDESTIAFALPAAPLAAPANVTRRVANVSVEANGTDVRVLARGIGRNGWVQTRLEFAEGRVISALPAWQDRQLAARALAPRWIAAAATIFAAGLIGLFGIRQRYESPNGSTGSSGAVDAPPDKLHPGVAGALAANGRIGLPHALSTLFALADRGVVTITEEPRRWGQRHFTLHRNRARHELSAEEAAVLNLAFRHKGQELESVPLAQARRRVFRGMREFKSAVTQEFRAQGMLDDERVRVRSLFLKFAVALLILTIPLLIPAMLLTRTYQGWPLLVVAATAAVGIAGLIFYASLTPLSNEGVRRAERWRSYRKHLKEVAQARLPMTATVSTTLPFAVALGLADAWSKYIKNHPTVAPSWFRALSTTGDDGAFPAFILAGGVEGSGGSHGGAGGGAAGGGGSGAG